MRQWLLSLFLEWAANYLTKEKIEEWEQEFASKVLPVLEGLKSQLIAGLAAKAALTETKIDDKVVAAADTFLTKLLDRLKA